MTALVNINTGVRQGSVLSPILFIIYMDKIIRQIEQRNFQEESFAYADDIAQVTNNKEILENKMSQWDATLTQQGLKQNYAKTEYMVVSSVQNAEDLIFNDTSIKRTGAFTY